MKPRPLLLGQTSSELDGDRDVEQHRFPRRPHHLTPPPPSEQLLQCCLGLLVRPSRLARPQRSGKSRPPSSPTHPPSGDRNAD